MTDSKFITWEKDGYLGILSLNNPSENYLINPDFVEIQQLKAWLSDDIRGLIISGTGRHFSAGADIKSLISQTHQAEELKQSMIQGNQLLDSISQLEIPVLATISGVCFGGGLEIALSSDIRICMNRSMFAFPEINHELIPGLGGLKRLKKICGQKTALEILLSGDIINAGKALELKIVDIVIPSKDCLDFGKQFMNGLIKERSPKLIQYLMRSFRNAESLEAKEAMLKDVEMFCELAHDFSVKSQNG
jgi:enoyl-CoA hydratase/carnithine racemase